MNLYSIKTWDMELQRFPPTRPATRQGWQRKVWNQSCFVIDKSNCGRYGLCCGDHFTNKGQQK